MPVAHRLSPRPAVPPTALPVASLAPRLGVASATALVVSNMVGSGIFGSTGLMAAALGDGRLILLAWLTGGILALAGALCYAELGVNLPKAGGEYYYLSRTMGPWWGLVTGWVSFFAGFTAPIAISALIFARYFEFLLPDPARQVWFAAGPFSLGGAQLLAAAAIAFFTALNCLGVNRSARVQNLLTSANVAVIVGLVLIGFLSGSGDWASLRDPVPRQSANPLAADFLIQLLWVMVGYSGWNAATYVTEELRRPARSLPKALVSGTLLVIVLYLLLNALFLYVTPLSELQGEIAVGETTLLRLFGPGSLTLSSLLLGGLILSNTNAMLTVGPRVYYAMAVDGAFPGFAARIHPRWRTPAGAILMQGSAAVLFTLTPLPQLLTFAGFTLTLFSLLAVGALLRLRTRPGWTCLPGVDFAFPLVPGIYMLAGGCMVAGSIAFQPAASLLVLAVIAAGVWGFRAMRGPAGTFPAMPRNLPGSVQSNQRG